jgi:S1/P1 Nuclease
LVVESAVNAFLLAWDQSSSLSFFLAETKHIARNEATALRSREGFQRDQLTELATTDFESWAKESFEIASKIAYRNDGRIGSPKAGAMDCTIVAAPPVLPAGYVVSASRIADRRMILAGYRLADLLTRVTRIPD